MTVYKGVMKLKDAIQKVMDILENNSAQLCRKVATIGFDGFIDAVVHVVKEKKDDSSIKYFNDIEDFGSHLISKKGVSGTIELREQLTKMGGNMPIMSNSIGRLGVRVNCIGAFGMPSIKEEFRGMEKANCTLYSIAEPGDTLALEFNDGKIMLAKMSSLDKLSWEDIKELVGVEKLIELYRSSDLIGIVNWSELANATSIWEGILREIVPHCEPSKDRIVFFDLSDCSKKPEVEIQRALDIMREFEAHYRVVLGMNENEARLIYTCITGEKALPELKTMGDILYNELKLSNLVIHPLSCSLAWDKDGHAHVNNRFIEEPKVSTGGGDHFNAGYCAAQLLQLDLEASMIIGNALSGCYIKNGYSASRAELIDFLREWKLSLIHSAALPL